MAPEEEEVDFEAIADPLDFPRPLIFQCKRLNVTAVDSQTETSHVLKNVLIKTEAESSHAYFLKTLITRNGIEKTWQAVVLRRLDSGKDKNFGVQWRSTKKVVAIKQFSSWQSLRLEEKRTICEKISALQFTGASNPRVEGCTEALGDGQNLYIILSTSSNVTLQSFIEPVKRKAYRLDEMRAKSWFTELCDGLRHLQQKGLYHGQLCLTNILLDKEHRILISGLSGCKRVPFKDPFNSDRIVDAAEGTCRIMLRYQGIPDTDEACQAPEILDDAFDAFAADLFSVGVVLFQVLTGFTPFKRAKNSDLLYKLISKGHLEELIVNMGISISIEATDLLQNLLWRNPHDRLTLAEILEHPWLKGECTHLKASSRGIWRACDIPMQRLKHEIVTRERKQSPTLNRKMRRSLREELLWHRHKTKHVSFGGVKIYHYDESDGEDRGTDIEPRCPRQPDSSVTKIAKNNDKQAVPSNKESCTKGAWSKLGRIVQAAKKRKPKGDSFRMISAKTP